jgi:hypothetical protein
MNVTVNGATFVVNSENDVAVLVAALRAIARLRAA